MQRIAFLCVSLVQLDAGRRVPQSTLYASDAMGSAANELQDKYDSGEHTRALLSSDPTKELKMFLLGFNPSLQHPSGIPKRLDRAAMQVTKTKPVSMSQEVQQEEHQAHELIPTHLRQVWPPADITPAVDVYATVPSKEDLEIPMLMTHGGPMPDGPDPFKLAEKDLGPVTNYVRELIGRENPILTQSANVFFEERAGKRFRPTIIALVARTLENENVADKPVKLATITEMIHVASLIHDDVLDEADTRRGGFAVHKQYTNQVAVLAGDYLLAKASLALARLQHSQVTEVMASALASLVEGEMMQATLKDKDLLEFNNYLRKSYYKTASLISCSCKSVALLSGYEEGDEITIAAEEFGYHLGMAYQIVDDILDFKGDSASLGKPAQADMELGLATAPILYASEVEPSLKELIQRKFKKEGDVQKAVRIAKDTDCIAKSYVLAEFHASRGLAALRRLPEGKNRQALEVIMYKALSRKK